MATAQDIADRLALVPIEDLAPIATMLADRLHAHRMTHGGRTPHALWRSCIEIGPSYACIELVLICVNRDNEWEGFYLKLRDEADQGWQGKKTIPGVSLMPLETLEQAQARLLAEFTDDSELSGQLRWQMFSKPRIEVEVHREDTDPDVEGRRVNCMTAVYIAKMPFGFNQRLKDGCVFVPLTERSDASIVDHHRNTLEGIFANEYT